MIGTRHIISTTGVVAGCSKDALDFGDVPWLDCAIRATAATAAMLRQRAAVRAWTHAT
jgi:hypothetical protein